MRQMQSLKSLSCLLRRALALAWRILAALAVNRPYIIYPSSISNLSSVLLHYFIVIMQLTNLHPSPLRLQNCRRHAKSSPCLAILQPHFAHFLLFWRCLECPPRHCQWCGDSSHGARSISAWWGWWQALQLRCQRRSVSRPWSIRGMVPLLITHMQRRSSCILYDDPMGQQLGLLNIAQHWTFNINDMISKVLLCS